MSSSADPVRVLAGRVVVVVGTERGIGRALVLGLADAAASVAFLGPRECGNGSRAEMERAFAAVVSERGRIDAVVFAWIDPDAFAPVPVAGTDAAAWDARAEAVLRRAIGCAQAAHGALTPHGGGIVFVTPTVGLTGAAGLVAQTTAIEGIRALAKSAARQWGGDGITVNCVAPPLELPAGSSAAAGEFGVPALGRLPDPRGDVAPVIVTLLTEVGRSITGATVVVDGGTVMVP